MNAEQKMLKARTNLVLDHPFFGCLALKMKLIEDKKVETAVTDGKSIDYNPSFIECLSNAETTGMLAHEVMHIALGHNWRQGDREHNKWNIACDYTINGNLEKAGFALPAGGLINHGEFDDMSAEEIYKVLPTQPDKKDKSSDPGGRGAVKKSKDSTAKAKAEMKAAVNQALQIAKGKLSTEILRQVQEILKTVVPWHVLLRDFVEMTARNDYNWSKPNRRYFSRGICLPSLISEELPEVVIAVDTSGSINKEQLDIFAAEASAVLGAYETTIRVIYCDARVQGEDVFTRADLPMTLKPVGGGGTNFTPVFEHIAKNEYAPSYLIYFTDLYGRFPKEEPDYPVMWLVTGKGNERKVPFGDVVKF